MTSTTETADPTDDATNSVADVGDIDTLRGQIDELDATIASLINERAQLSRRIQTARVSAGGTRIQLGRERAVIDHYRTAIGAEGPQFAEAVLRACRGAR